ncbi:MAG TPA: hypothetical protein VK501_03620 [Baekduia sp.]|nr:hypothetical protein [Baekduia sp.]
MATLRPTFTGCAQAGQTATVTCQEAHLDAVSQSWFGTLITGTVRGISCTVTALGCVASVTGNLSNSTYDNGSYILALNGTTGMSASWSANIPCRTLYGLTTTGPGSAPATFNTTTGFQSFTVNTSFKPNIQHN